MDQVCAHMTVLNPVGKWSDKTSVLKDAQNYYTKSVWQKASPGAYEAAKKLGIFDEAVAHMTVVRRSWSVEDVIASTIGHTTVYGWRKAEPKAYAAASRLGILETITAKLQKLNPIGKWSSKESVVKDARKYKTRTEWYKQSAGAYSAAKKKGWFEEAVAHMES